MSVMSNYDVPSLRGTAAALFYVAHLKECRTWKELREEVKSLPATQLQRRMLSWLAQKV